MYSLVSTISFAVLFLFSTLMIGFMMNKVTLCTHCTDRRSASLTAINLPLKRVIINPFQDPFDKYSAQPTLLTLQLGQKYFLPEKSYVTDNRKWLSAVTANIFGPHCQHAVCRCGLLFATLIACNVIYRLGQKNCTPPLHIFNPSYQCIHSRWNEMDFSKILYVPACRAHG